MKGGEDDEYEDDGDPENERVASTWYAEGVYSQIGGDPFQRVRVHRCTFKASLTRYLSSPRLDHPPRHHLLARLLDLLKHIVVRHLALDHHRLLLKAHIVGNAYPAPSITVSSPTYRTHLAVSTVPARLLRSTLRMTSKTRAITSRYR